MKALGSEMQAVRAQQRHQHVGLVDGEYLGRAKDRHAYRFRLAEDLTTVDGSPARLRHQDRWHDAEVVNTSGRLVVLNVAAQLQGPLASGLLQMDASFLVQLLIDGWRNANGDEDFNWSLVTACLESADLSERLPVEAPEAVVNGFKLNERQASVIGAAFTTARTYLWGPPGTGKTTAVAALVHEFVRAGASVLLVSNTNAALDTAVLRIVNCVGLEEYSVVRVGGGSDGGLGAQSPPILLHEVMADRGSSLAQDRETAGLRLLAARKRLRGLRQERDDCERELQGLSRLKLDQTDGVATAALKDKQLAAVCARSERFRQQLMRQERQAAATGAKPSAALLRDVRLSEADVAKLARAAKEARRQSEKLTRAYQDSLERGLVAANRARFRACDDQVSSVQLQVATHQREVDLLDAQLKALHREIVQTADVVAATAYKACADQAIRTRQYDVVVVDEASMLPLSLCLLVVGLARRSVVFAGDFRQLSPIAISSDEDAGRWLRRDAFTAASIPTLVKTGAHPRALVTLQEQHRMRPQIAETVSAVSYLDAPLKTPESVRQRPCRPGFLLDSPLVLLDTSSLGSRIAREAGRSSRYNLVHAQLVAALADVAWPAEGGDVGIISPYRAQAKLLSTIRQSAQTSTVHRFQGGERDTILLDTTVGGGGSLGQWFVAQDVEDEGARLLNVAISRARERLIVIADVDRLLRDAPAAGPVRRFLRRCQTFDLLPLARLTDGGQLVRGLSLDDLINDVRRSRTQVLICSRALSRRAVSSLVASARPADTVVVTRPPTHAASADRERHALRIAELEAGGIRVEQRDPCAEDWAVIDERITWTRSGGILSAGSDPEWALRREDPAMATQLLLLQGRKRLPSDPPIAPGRWTSACPTCSRPRARVERFDGRVWDACADFRCRPMEDRTRERIIPLQSDEHSRRREELQRVAVHDFLVDDK